MAKTHYERKTDTKNKEIRCETKHQTDMKQNMQSLGAPNWTPLHKCPALETYCTKCGKKDTTQKCEDRNTLTTNRSVKRLIEDETDDRNETSSESDVSIHHIKE